MTKILCLATKLFLHSYTGMICYIPKAGNEPSSSAENCMAGLMLLGV
jgi:hypothetical protein